MRVEEVKNLTQDDSDTLESRLRCITKSNIMYHVTLLVLIKVTL